MKKLLVLFLLTVSISLALLWRQPVVESSPASKPETAASAADGESIGATAAPAPTRQSTATAQRALPLPASFAGTQVDGQFRLDAAGNLVIDADIRRIFDYFLSALGAEPLETSVHRLRQHIQQQLEQPAESQAIALLGQYLDYKRQLLVLEKDHTRIADLNAMRQRLAAVHQLRASLFDAQAHQAFFAMEEDRDNLTLARLAILHDRSLDATAKGAAIDRLHHAQPAELLDSLAPQLQHELRQRTRQLQTNGGSPTQLRQLRQQLVGNEATERLEALDHKRQEWQQRLAAYRAEKARIENSRGLGEADKQAAIARIAQERFAENERLRLEAAEQRLIAEGT